MISAKAKIYAENIANAIAGFVSSKCFITIILLARQL